MVHRTMVVDQGEGLGSMVHRTMVLDQDEGLGSMVHSTMVLDQDEGLGSGPTVRWYWTRVRVWGWGPQYDGTGPG